MSNQQYHHTMHIKIPENGFTHSLYTLYSINNKAIKMDISSMFNNCNMTLINKYDKSSTAGKVSCIPISILESLCNSKINRDSLSDEQYKEKLLSHVLSKTDYDDKELLNKYKIYYKPIFTKPIVTSSGWETNPATNDELEFVKDEEKDNSNRHLWMSNFNLRDLMVSYILLKPSSLFLGVLFLTCFDKFDDYDMKNVYNRTALRKELQMIINKDSAKSYNNYRFYLSYIVSHSHWSSFIIDTKLKRCYHFCSGGNRPSDYKKNKQMIFFSSSRSFIRGGGDKVRKIHAPKNAIFEQFIEAGYTIFLNVEACQMLSGECGMFASMFLIFYSLQDIETFSQIKALYNSFSFLGDKSMGLYKELLFWRESKQCIRTTKVSDSIILKWKSLIDESLKLINEANSDIALVNIKI